MHFFCLHHITIVIHNSEQLNGNHEYSIRMFKMLIDSADRQQKLFQKWKMFSLVEIYLYFFFSTSFNDRSETSLHSRAKTASEQNSERKKFNHQGNVNTYECIIGVAPCCILQFRYIFYSSSATHIRLHSNDCSKHRYNSSTVYTCLINQNKS